MVVFGDSLDFFSGLPICVVVVGGGQDMHITVR